MYTREEASKLRQEFWTAFGQYMAPVPSAEGVKANWINYKTGLKDVYFRMKADTSKATIGIEITHNDVELQEIFFDQFLQLKTALQEYLQEEWSWQLQTQDEYGKTISVISTKMENVNIFDRQCWPKLISFFKQRIIAVDEFWTDAKFTFDALK